MILVCRRTSESVTFLLEYIFQSLQKTLLRVFSHGISHTTPLVIGSITKDKRNRKRDAVQILTQEYT